MAKASTVGSDLLNQCLTMDYMLGDTVVLAADHKGLTAGTRLTVEDVYVDASDLKLFMTVMPEGSDPLDDALEPTPLEASLLTDVAGQPLASHAIFENGEVKIPMSELPMPPQLSKPASLSPVPLAAGSQIVPMSGPLPVVPQPLAPTAGPMFPPPPGAPAQDPVAAIFTAYAPDHPVTARLQLFYGLVGGGTVTRLQEVMAELNLLTDRWTVSATAQILAALLERSAMTVPDDVLQLIDGTPAPAPVAPPIAAPAPAPLPVPAPVEPVAVAPVAPAPVPTAPPVEAAAPEEKKTRRGRPTRTGGYSSPETSKDLGDEAAAPNAETKLDQTQLAALTALIGIYQLDSTNFEKNVSVAMDAIRRLV
jgi:hypothetical protein